MKVIKFSAEWCGPCKSMAAIFNKVKDYEEFKNLQFIEYDIESDDAIELVNKYHIKSVPTIVVTDDNNEQIKKLIGLTQEKQFVQFLNDCFNG